MQTYTRSYCRTEGAEQRFRFAGYATSDANENHVRPRAYYQSCSSCTLNILTLGGHRDVPDALGLCLAVLVEYKRKVFGRKSDEDLFDETNVLGELHGFIWQLYNRWNPSYGDGKGTFRGYATGIMRQKIKTFIARTTGDAAGSRTFPKPHAPSVSTSYEGLVESSFNGGHQGNADTTRHDRGGLDFALGAVALDPTADSALGGSWLDTLGGARTHGNGQGGNSPAESRAAT